MRRCVLRPRQPDAVTPCKWPPSPVELGPFAAEPSHFSFCTKFHPRRAACINPSSHPASLCPKGKSTNIRCTGVSSLPVRRLFVQALRSARFFERVAHGRMGSRYFPSPAFCTLRRLPRAGIDRRLPPERVLRRKPAGEHPTSSTIPSAELATGWFRRGALQPQTRSRPRTASPSRDAGMQPAAPQRQNSSVIYDNLYSWGSTPS